VACRISREAERCAEELGPWSGDRAHAADSCCDKSQGRIDIQRVCHLLRAQPSSIAGCRLPPALLSGGTSPQAFGVQGRPESTRENRGVRETTGKSPSPVNDHNHLAPEDASGFLPRMPASVHSTERERRITPQRRELPGDPMHEPPPVHAFAGDGTASGAHGARPYHSSRGRTRPSFPESRHRNGGIAIECEVLFSASLPPAHGAPTGPLRAEEPPNTESHQTGRKRAVVSAPVPSIPPCSQPRAPTESTNREHDPCQV
jgi:hypothetical protein